MDLDALNLKNSPKFHFTVLEFNLILREKYGKIKKYIKHIGSFLKNIFKTLFLNAKQEIGVTDPSLATMKRGWLFWGEMHLLSKFITCSNIVFSYILIVNILTI